MQLRREKPSPLIEFGACDIAWPRKVDQSIAAQQARTAGMNQIVVLPVIENALLKAVLAWYL